MLKNSITLLHILRLSALVHEFVDKIFCIHTFVYIVTEPRGAFSL